MSRSPLEVVETHSAAVTRGDIDAVMAGDSADAVVTTVDTVLRGHDEIRSFSTTALQGVAEPRFDLDSTPAEGDAVLVTWGVTSPTARASGAVDTFVVVDDRIRLHTTVFTLEPVATG